MIPAMKHRTLKGLLLASSFAAALIGSPHVAHAQSSPGAPVGQMYGTYNASSLPAPSAGQSVPAQSTADGSIRMGLSMTFLTGKTGLGVNIAVPYQVGTTSAIPLGVSPFIYNGASMDSMITIQGETATGVGALDVEEGGRSGANITTATTTLVKSGAGTFDTLCINTLVASGAVKLYDSLTATGTVIATITNPATLVTEGPLCARYNRFFSTGLTAVTTGAQDVTITFR